MRVFDSAGAGGALSGVDLMTRIYTFRELMVRLMSDTCTIVQHQGEFIFMPCIYKGKPQSQSGPASQTGE